MVRRKVELAGRYRLEEPLGRGGMGEVWRGVDLRLRRPVAVKILPLTIAAEPTGVARFRREAEVAATLNQSSWTWQQARRPPPSRRRTEVGWYASTGR